MGRKQVSRRTIEQLAKIYLLTVMVGVRIIHYNAGRHSGIGWRNVMDSDDLLELADDPNFISGIYNYCDRWCDRCAFTSRCFLYASEKADVDQDDPDTRDLNNAKFWRKLALIFKDTHDLIRKCAEEAGVDLDSIEAEAAIAAHDRKTETAKKHELSTVARDYARMVEQWFAKELAEEEKIHVDAARSETPAEKIDLAAAVEVIRWYQFFIAAKVFRALLNDDDEESENDPPDDHEMLRDSAQNDSNGSAKVALIAIDRSMSAWWAVQSCLPDKKDSTAPLMAVLERLRDGIETVLPQARDFLRPGFDEVLSDYVS